jgi:hypothetical protein
MTSRAFLSNSLDIFFLMGTLTCARRTWMFFLLAMQVMVKIPVIEFVKNAKSPLHQSAKLLQRGIKNW